MPRFLAIGLGPLFERGVEKVHVGGLRTWSFVEPLLAEGHEVRLFTVPDRVESSESQGPCVRQTVETEATPVGKWSYEVYDRPDSAYILRDLARIVESWAPDGVVAVSAWPAWLAAHLPGRAPLWVDFGIFSMIEHQAQAVATRDDEPIAQAWRMEAQVARRADKLSTVTRPHLHAQLGQLALLGRLNRHTFHYHFAHHIPHACHPSFLAKAPAGEASVLRGKAVPEDAFILLWSGVYTRSTDPRLLHRFLEEVMQAAPQVHFVSTGGESAITPAPTYAQFRHLVEASPHRDRYHLLGWVPSERLPAIYRESDLGLAIDEANYETFFGARARICNLMAAGVPPLATYGTEISRLIEEAACGIVCTPGDSAELVQGVLDMVRAPEQWHKLSVRAREYAEAEFDARRLAEPLLEWASAPALSPDNAWRARTAPREARLLDIPLNSLDRRGMVMDHYDLAELRRAKLELDAVHAKWWWQPVRIGMTAVSRLAALQRRLRRGDKAD